MSHRGEQGMGVIIASVTEECEGGDYGKNSVLNPASLLSLQQLIALEWWVLFQVLFWMTFV